MKAAGTRSTLRPFRLPSARGGPIRRGLSVLTRPAVEKVLAFGRLNDLYTRVNTCGLEASFFDRTLRMMDVQVEVSEADLAAVPKTGPLVIVANHPFGGLEAIILGQLLERIGRPFRFLANFMLAIMPELGELIFPVDPFGGRESTRRSIAGIKGAMRWVADGGALAIFPAGEVAHARLGRLGVTDPPWHASVGRIIQRTGAPVLPVFFEGRNSLAFQLMGLVHPRLRTMMLGRELLNKQRRRVGVHIGHAIEATRLAAMDDPEELIGYLRVRTHLLRSRSSESSAAHVGPTGRNEEPVVDPVDPALLAEELERLDPSQLLVANGTMDVWRARAEQIPNLLREIGRLRELAFRAVGEGTGRSIDLDRFDQTYLHLFVWDRSVGRVVGAYRLGATDEILAGEGKSGLYTSTLFDFKSRLLRQLDPALELGRSFVTPDYQKSYAALMLLWKGIGHYVVANPRYRMLLGPVSVSNDYSSMSRCLLMQFLRQNRFLGDMARLVRPKHPPHATPLRDFSPGQLSMVVRDLDEVDDLIRQLESDRRSMPVLLRQYLKLNGRLIGFNIDPQFGDVLDALMLIDLTLVDRRVLRKYLGEGTDEFLARHGVSAAGAAR
ncbi:MAG: hypothetical protein BIFFINMI_00801 [Phycisphaerae bacterium]|nr:hypothetical protein [Phycisphaerae bacterium]